jgi:hypothetical protein
MVDLYDARQSGADTKLAAIVTAAFALGTLTVAVGKQNSGDVSSWLVMAVLILGALSVVVAFLVRVLFGLHPERKPWLSTESQRFRNAQAKLARQHGDEDPIHVRKLALEMWQAREQDSHRMASAKDLGGGIAAFLLALALIGDLILGLQLI